MSVATNAGGGVEVLDYITMNQEPNISQTPQEPPVNPPSDLEEFGLVIQDL